MRWLLFLHWYQPANQKPEILQQVVEQSYRPILRLLKENPGIKINCNINGCLTEQLAEKYPDIISDIIGRIKKGQIELVASAKNHAFLPLMSEDEIHRQVALDNETNRSYFSNDNYQPQAFFPTELAYHPLVAACTFKFRFKALIIDELSLFGNLRQTDWARRYGVKSENATFILVPANKHWSSELRGDRNMKLDDFFWYVKEQFSDQNKVLITANDAELFGHHYPERIDLLTRAFSDTQIKFVTISEYLTDIPKDIHNTTPVPATWDTWESNLSQSPPTPYPLWDDPKNQIHRLQWELANFAISVMTSWSEPLNDLGWKWHSARQHLDLGLSSCYWWWASCQPWWYPDMICYGALQLIKVIRTSKIDIQKKLMAEHLYSTLTQNVWEWHWSGEAQRRIDEHDKAAGK